MHEGAKNEPSPVVLFRDSSRRQTGAQTPQVEGELNSIIFGILPAGFGLSKPLSGNKSLHSWCLTETSLDMTPLCLSNLLTKSISRWSLSQAGWPALARLPRLSCTMLPLAWSGGLIILLVPCIRVGSTSKKFAGLRRLKPSVLLQHAKGLDGSENNVESSFHSRTRPGGSEARPPGRTTASCNKELDVRKFGPCGRLFYLLRARTDYIG